MHEHYHTFFHVLGGEINHRNKLSKWISRIINNFRLSKYPF